MATRRMFSISVISHPRFLQLPPTARLAFYDLCMGADDDGFVEAFNVMRLTGATDDDLQVLQRIDYVRVLNPDYLCWIPVWSASNKVPPDRYKQSMYHSALPDLMAGRQVELSFINACMMTVRKQNVDKLDTQDSLCQGSPVQGIIGESRSGSGHGDGDHDHERFVFELKNLLASWYGFKSITSEELTKLLYQNNIDAEVICWIAGKAADNAQSPQKYFRDVVQEKCFGQRCKTKADLIRLEPDDKKRICDITDRVNALRKAIDDELPI